MGPSSRRNSSLLHNSGDESRLAFKHLRFGHLQDCWHIASTLPNHWRFSLGQVWRQMEHLWIDFQLNRGHAAGRAPFPFRFQKRASGRDRLTSIDNPGYQNVGHYSVRPDFDLLLHIGGGPSASVDLRIHRGAFSEVEEARRIQCGAVPFPLRVLLFFAR